MVRRGANLERPTLVAPVAPVAPVVLVAPVAPVVLVAPVEEDPGTASEQR